MDKPFFIMLYNPLRVGAMPLLDKYYSVLFFSTAQEAMNAMVGSAYAEAHGFEVHEMGNDNTKLFMN